MSYINDSTVSIRTILTLIGKKKLARGQFVPAYFQLSDSAVDYGLFTISDPAVITDGDIIQEMPVPLQTQYSSFFPLFNKLSGAQTT